MHQQEPAYSIKILENETKKGQNKRKRPDDLSPLSFTDFKKNQL